MLRKILPGFAILSALFLSIPAHADSLVRFAQVESIGGFTRFNDTMTFWARVDSQNAVKGGMIRVVRNHHGGTPLTMTGSLTAEETRALWSAVYKARPWTARQVRNRMLNVDLPNTKVTYMGIFSQLIRSDLQATRLRPVSADMLTFLDLAWEADARCAESGRFVYEAWGGRLGYRRQVTIQQDGQVHDEVTYAVQISGVKPYSYDGWLDADQIATLEKLVGDAKWSTLQDFPGHPSHVDGIDEQGSHYRWGVKKTVFGGYPSSRTAEYQAVLDFAKAAGGSQ